MNLRLLGWLLLLSTRAAAGSLPLHVGDSGKGDLRIRGLLPGVPADQVRYLRYADLAALPTTTVKSKPEWLHDEHLFTVVFIADFLKALNLPSEADTLLANSSDGYQSNYRKEFIAEYRPFFVIKIDGHEPAEWPGNQSGNRGPYYLSASEKLVPAFGQLLDNESKRPFAVVEVVLVNSQKTFAPVFAGERGSSNPVIAAGREIYLNHCSSCHGSADGTFGGKLSTRPYEALVTLSQANPDYFTKRVIDPKQFDPTTKMPAHPQYTPQNLEQLLAFMKAK